MQSDYTISPNIKQGYWIELSAFDRVLFKGHLGTFFRKQDFNYFLYSKNLLIKDFPAYAEFLAKKITKHAREVAESCGAEYRYLPSLKISKEDVALRIQKEKRISNGLICVLGSVESCRCFSTHKNVRSGNLEILLQDRKCKHLYFYYMDEEFGFMHVRLQAWFPFGIQV